MTSAEYIESRSVPEPNSGCWIWLGATTKGGYGNIGGNAKVTYAHRLSYLSKYGEIPAGLVVRHKCNQKWCVNPEHLTVGTQAQNLADKRRFGTNAQKLTESKVQTIRRLYKFGVTLASLARKFKVTHQSVSAVTYNRTWKQ